MSIYQLESGVAAPTIVANRVYEWAGAATLKLNASKTKAMMCGSRDLVHRILPDLPHIEVSGIPVKNGNRALYSLNFFCHLTTFELSKNFFSPFPSHILITAQPYTPIYLAT